MVAPNLDMDLLRTLVVATDLGGFVRAAAQLGRSQSAISLQMKKLEEQIGLPLFRREGRGLALTEAGDLVLTYARRILELNDETLSVARGSTIEGTVRLGVLPDFDDDILAKVLARFGAAHPLIHVQLEMERSQDLFSAIGHGVLDLAVAFGMAENASFSVELPTVWIGKPGHDIRADTPLPLALLTAPCMFRNTAIEALERVKRQWRLTFTSPRLPGLWSAVRAGIGLTARAAIGLPSDVAIIDDADLPALPPTQLVLCSRTRRLAAPGERLRSILTEELTRATAPVQGATGRLQARHQSVS